MRWDSTWSSQRADDGQLVDVGQAVAAVPLPPRPRRLLVAAGRAPVAEGVGLVEEHDDAAVAQGQLADLAVHPLHLHRGDAHEGLDEGGGVDEHVRLAGLTGDGLGHQRLAGAGRPPQQDAVGDVAALGLDLGRSLEEVDGLADPAQHRVLAPDVGEAGLDLAGLVGVDAAEEEEHVEDRDAEDPHERVEDQQPEQRQRAGHRLEEGVHEPPGCGGEDVDGGDAPLPGEEQAREHGEERPTCSAAGAGSGSTG